MNRRYHRHRLGVSLIEMCVAITLISAALGMVAVHLHALLATERSSREHAVVAASLSRIADQFRQDAHAATAAALAAPAASDDLAPADAPAATRMVFTLPAGRTILYQVEDQELVRVASQGSDARRRERYRLPAAAAVRWVAPDSQSAPLASVVITHPTSSQPGAEGRQRTTRIDAAVGLDFAFAPAREP